MRSDYFDCESGTRRTFQHYYFFYSVTVNCNYQGGEKRGQELGRQDPP